MIRDDANERVTFYRATALPGVEVMTVCKSSRRWHFFHERYAFSVCRRASAGVRYRGTQDLLQDGSITFREPGEPVTDTFVAKPCDFKTLSVDPALFEQAVAELGISEPVHFPPASINDDAHLLRLLFLLCASVQRRAPALEQQSLFAAGFMAILQHTEQGPPKVTASNGKLAVQRAKDYLRERFNEPVSLDELARAARTSRFHLVHAFTSEVGLSPHAYQVHVRVERARALLERGVPAVIAATNAGFADQSHLARHFKRVMHITPSGYARAFSWVQAP